MASELDVSETSPTRALESSGEAYGIRDFVVENYKTLKESQNHILSALTYVARIGDGRFVEFEPFPFDSGSMQFAFRGELLKSNKEGKLQRAGYDLVVKIPHLANGINDTGIITRYHWLETCARSSVDRHRKAIDLGRDFNEAKVTKKIKIKECFLAQIIEIPPLLSGVSQDDITEDEQNIIDLRSRLDLSSLLFDGSHVTAEAFISGKFTKFLNNDGTVCNKSTVTNLPGAFAHWTWEKTKGNFMVCDIQGVRKATKYILTDPCVHSRRTMNGERYGSSDLGEEGMREFFIKHECNLLCKDLNLEPITQKASTLDDIVQFTRKKEQHFVKNMRFEILNWKNSLKPRVQSKDDSDITTPSKELPDSTSTDKMLSNGSKQPNKEGNGETPYKTKSFGSDGQTFDALPEIADPMGNMDIQISQSNSPLSDHVSHDSIKVSSGLNLFSTDSEVLISDGNMESRGISNGEENQEVRITHVQAASTSGTSECNPRASDKKDESDPSAQDVTSTPILNEESEEVSATYMELKCEIPPSEGENSSFKSPITAPGSSENLNGVRPLTPEDNPSPSENRNISNLSPANSTTKDDPSLPVSNEESIYASKHDSSSEELDDLNESCLPLSTGGNSSPSIDHEKDVPPTEKQCKSKEIPSSSSEEYRNPTPGLINSTAQESNEKLDSVPCPYLESDDKFITLLEENDETNEASSDPSVEVNAAKSGSNEELDEAPSPSLKPEDVSSTEEQDQSNLSPTPPPFEAYTAAPVLNEGIEEVNSPSLKPEESNQSISSAVIYNSTGVSSVIQDDSPFTEKQYSSNESLSNPAVPRS